MLAVILLLSCDPGPNHSNYDLEYIYDADTELCFAAISPRSTYKGGSVLLIECTPVVKAKASPP